VKFGGGRRNASRVFVTIIEKKGIGKKKEGHCRLEAKPHMFLKNA